MDLQKILENYGLEEKEAKTYLALLGLGETTATVLAEKTNLGRTQMYQITNNLIEKGLVSHIIKNSVRYFSAAEPETLLKKIQEKEFQLQQALPELKLKRGTLTRKAKVEVYQGKEGVYTVLKMITRDKTPYYFMGGAGEAGTILEIETEKTARQATNLRIKGKILARKQDDFWISKNEDYRFIPDHMISSTTMALWGNKTAIMIWAEPYYAILIDNEEVTKSNLATFNQLWNTGEKPTKADREKRLLKD